MHENLEKIRKKRGLSQNQIAIAAGISQGSFNMALRGKIPFWKGWRTKVAHALNLPEDEVFPEYADRRAQ